MFNCSRQIVLPTRMLLGMLSFFITEKGSAQINHRLSPNTPISVQKSKASHESIGNLEQKLFGYKYNRHNDSTVVLRPIKNQRQITSVNKVIVQKGTRVTTGDYKIRLKPQFKSKVKN